MMGRGTQIPRRLPGWGAKPGAGGNGPLVPVRAGRSGCQGDEAPDLAGAGGAVEAVDRDAGDLGLGLLRHDRRMPSGLR